MDLINYTPAQLTLRARPYVVWVAAIVLFVCGVICVGAIDSVDFTGPKAILISTAVILFLLCFVLWWFCGRVEVASFNRTTGVFRFEEKFAGSLRTRELMKPLGDIDDVVLETANTGANSTGGSRIRMGNTDIHDHAHSNVNVNINAPILNRKAPAIDTDLTYSISDYNEPYRLHLVLKNGEDVALTRMMSSTGCGCGVCGTGIQGRELQNHLRVFLELETKTQHSRQRRDNDDDVVAITSNISAGNVIDIV